MRKRRINKVTSRKVKRNLIYSLSVLAMLITITPAKEVNAAMADSTVKSLINSYVSKNTSTYTINGYFYYESYMSSYNETYNKTYYERGKGRWSDAAPKNVNSSFYTPDKSASGGLEMGITTDWGFLPTSASWEASLRHLHGGANPTRADYIRRVKQGYSRAKTTPQLKGITVTDYAYKSGTNYWVKPNATVKVRVHAYQQYPGTKYQMDDYIRMNYLRLYNSGVDAKASMTNGGATNYFQTNAELAITKNTSSKSDGDRNLYTTFNVTPKVAGKAYQLHSYATSANGKSIGYTASGSYLKTDGVLPSGSFSPNSSVWTKNSVTVAFNPSDSHSGVKRWRWRASSNNGSTYGGWSAYINGDTTSNITVSATASNKLQSQVEDNVGNVATVTSGTYQIDKTVPTGTITGNPSSWTNGNPTLTLTASDSGGSGYYRTKLPNGTYSTSTKPTYTVSANGTYKFIVYDNVGNSKEISTVVSKIDKTAPSGTITGNPTAWTNGNASLKLTATDAGGSGYYRTKLPDGTYSSSTAPTYTATANGTFSFVVYDYAGNSKTVSVSVTKIDKTAPSGSITGNPTSWTNGNASLTFNATDTGGSGVKSIKKPDGTTVTTTSTTYTATANGTYNFIVTDNTGNVRTVGVSVTKIDKTIPGGTITGNPTAWTNANATLTLSATDTGGSGYYRTKLPNGTYSSSTTPTYTATANGTYSFVVYDYAGNARTVSVVVNRIDKTVPNGSITGNPTSWTNGNASLKLTATDTGGSGYYRTKLPNGTYSSSTTPTYTATYNGTYSFIVYDYAGNTRTVSVVVNRIDKTLPSGSITGNPTSWTNGNASLKLTATDTGGSGYYRTKLPNGTYSSSTTPTYTATYNGTYSFVVYDYAGNARTVSVVVNRIDKTLPSGTITGNPTSWTNGNASLKLTATDTGGSGYYRTKLPNGTYSTSTTPTYTATYNGTFSFVVYDYAGNARTVSVVVNRIDKTLPSGSITGNPTSWTNGSASLKLTATDTGGSGYYRTKLPNGTYSTSTTPTYTATANGTYSFVVYDYAGNARTVSVVVNRIDKSLPTVSIVQTPTTWTNGNVTLTATGSDTGGAGVKSITLPNGTVVNGASSSQLITANGTYTFKVTDNAGNVTSKSIAVTNIDKSLPSGTITGNPTAWTNANATLTIKATDTGGAGVKSIKKPDNTVVNGTTTTYTATANGTYYFVVTDNAGNTKTVSVVVNRIDKALPSGSVTGNPTAWTNANATLTFNATDTGGAGVKSIKKPDNTTVTSTSTTYVVSANGTYNFVVTDNAGNSKSVSISVNRIDKSLPTLSIVQTPTAWTNGNVTLIATGSDTGGSGVKSITLPSGNVVSGSIASQVITVNGTYSFRVTDNAGNITSKSITITTIDKVLPTIGRTEIRNATQDSFDVYVYDVKDVNSGISKVQFPVWTNAAGQDDLLSTWQTDPKASGTNMGNGTWKFTVKRNEHNYEFGYYTIHIYAYDVAGNKKSASISYELRDVVKPTVSVSGNPTSWTGNSIVLTVKGYDAHTGVKSITLPDGTVVVKNGGKGVTVSHTYTITKNGSYTFIVKDMYGNTASYTTIVNMIDKTAPNGTIIPSTTAWTNKDVVLTINTSDVGSGVKTIQLPDDSIVKGVKAPFTAIENGTYSFDITDNVGNVKTVSVIVANIDKVAPANGTIGIEK